MQKKICGGLKTTTHATPPYPPHPTHLPHSPPSAVQVQDDKYAKPPPPSSNLTILSLVKCASVFCLFTVLLAFFLGEQLYRSISPLVDLNNLPITIDSDLGAKVLNWANKLSGLLRETNDRISVVQTSGGSIGRTHFYDSHSHKANGTKVVKPYSTPDAQD